MGPTDTDTHTCATSEALARHVAEWLCRRAVERNSTVAVCLSGGSTPRRVYELLAERPIASRFPWEHVHWFWGDERFVPHDHPDSNFRMVDEAMLSRVPVPAANIHAIPTTGISAEHAAAIYESGLKTFYGADTLDPARPLFDATLLGIGEDGHTASLFPGDAALSETRRWTAAVGAPKSLRRITLTYPALNSSRDAAFLATGEEKRNVVAGARAGNKSLPAANIHPMGQLHWFIDKAAAAMEVH